MSLCPFDRIKLFIGAATRMKPTEGRRRVIIEEIQPSIDAGRYPAKRIVGDVVTVTAAEAGAFDEVAQAKSYLGRFDVHLPNIRLAAFLLSVAVFLLFFVAGPGRWSVDRSPQ